MKKYLCILLMLALMITLVACNKDEPKNPTEPSTPTIAQTEPTQKEPINAPRGVNKTVGHFNVFVPEGMVATADDSMDAISIVDDADANHYFKLAAYNDEDSAKEAVEAVEAEGKTDASATENSKNWVGYEFTNGFSMYSKVDNRYVVVTGYGEKYDTYNVKQMLGMMNVIG